MRSKREDSGPTEPRDYVAIGLAYARAVLSGEIAASKWIGRACQRQLDDLRRAETDPAWPYVFDRARAARPCRFLEHLPHIKGEWAARKEKIRLEPWMCFVYATVFGWVRRDEPEARRFRTAYVCVPRKNAKTTLAAGTGLYMLAADGEFGAEVYAGATSRRQAGEVFRPAKLMVEKNPRLKELFGIHLAAQRISVLPTASFMEACVRKPGDGSSPSCAIVDEYHEHSTNALADTMSTGMGARKRPLLWIITTAGFNLAGPCYTLQLEAQQMLEGTLEREDLFAAIYTIDAGDDWTSEAALRKANPNYGVSVNPVLLRNDQAAAIQSPHKQAVFLTKHLNVWVGSLTPWLNLHKWNELANTTLRLDDFAGAACWIGCDLSSVIDLTAVVMIFKRLVEGIEHCYLFSRFYLPLERALDPGYPQYRAWHAAGALTATPGATVDLSQVRQDLLRDAERFQVRAMAFDPWCAVETQQELQRELGTDVVISIPQQTRYLSHPMKEFERLALEGRLHHNGNPVMTWCVSNCVAKPDANGNVFPRKPQGQEQSKIDGAVAAIMALSRALADVGGAPQEIEIW